MQFRALGAAAGHMAGPRSDGARHRSRAARVRVKVRPMPDVPDVIGHSEVVGPLGKGAMGEVYEGRDKSLGRRVALKTLGARHRESTEFKTRFLREGRALAAMNHPNIVQIYAIGEHERRPY